MPIVDLTDVEKPATVRTVSERRIPMSSFAPTAEQQDILDAFHTGGNMVIEAGAGTGKTTTLKLLSESSNQAGLYVAYNKAIQTDAEGAFPPQIMCRTMHSLAFQSVGRSFAKRLFDTDRVPPWEVAKFLGVYGTFNVSRSHSLVQNAVSNLVRDTVNRFCYSADREVGRHHVPNVKGMEDYREKIKDYITPLAQKMWADLMQYEGRCNFTHDYYLKIWALNNPKLDYDFIMLDEAQDANPLIADVFSKQTHAQLISVGDACQSIYQWRGATDYLSKAVAEHRLCLTQSFRFGQVIADEANKWLDLLASPLRLKGFGDDSKLGRLPSPDAILCRTNAEVVAQALAAQAAGTPVAIVGGTAEIEKFAKAADDLKMGKRTLHPDLAAFETWGDVQDYAGSDEGRDLQVFVNLVDKYGTDTILAVGKASVSEKKAKLIVSTAHKAKGREWHNVRIGTDFREPQEDEGMPTRPEMMLNYVSVTRAQKILDRGGLAFVDKLRGGLPVRV